MVDRAVLELERERAKRDLEEFIKQVEAEFGPDENWEKRKGEAKAETGADYVGIFKDPLITRYSEMGFVYRVHVGRTRFTVKLSPEDVGLDRNNPAHVEFLEKYAALGSKFLLPAETLQKLDTIERRIRRAVDEKYGIPTRVGTFVPFKNVPELKKEVEELKREYFEVRDTILTNYEAIKEQTAEFYRRYAVEAIRLLKRDPGYEPTPEEVERFVNVTMAHFPSRERIERSFYVYLEANMVASTEFLRTQQEKLELIRERSRQYRKKLELIERQLQEEERLQRERERNDLLLERKRLELEMKRLKIEEEAIREAVEEKKKILQEELEETFADIAGAVHGIVYDTLKKVSEALAIHGTLRPGDVRSLSSLVEKVRLLMVSEDPDVERWLKEIEEVIGTPAEKREVHEVKAALDAVRAEAGRFILSLGRVPRTIKGVELPDIEADLAKLGDVRVSRRVRQEQVCLEFPEIEQPVVRRIRRVV